MLESLFADASLRLEKALKHAEISPDAIERLKFPKASLRVSIPVRLDDGSLRVFQGYRVRYDDTRGPTKGGIASQSSLTEVCIPSSLQTSVKSEPDLRLSPQEATG